MVGPPQYPGQDPGPGDPGAPGYGAPGPGPAPAPAPYPGVVGGQASPGWYQGADGQWYQAPPPGYPQAPAPAYGAPAPYQNQPSTNGFAVAALVCSLAGLLCGVGAILGIIFGFIGRSQIRQSGGVQKGDGMALAGIIIGFAFVLIVVVVVIVAVATSHNCGGLNQPAC